MPETKMIHIRFPTTVIDKMTVYLKERGLNRNSFIVEAVTEKLRREMQVKTFRETRGALTHEDAPEWTKTGGTKWVQGLRGKDEETSLWNI
ncbi:hypothetical protein MHLNE_07180 [Moorella humiferrea]|uniref:YlcI/YnfO family protein n=1 Tax=Neomoorella humiferrea TaxID=676965 RepID=UPI0030D61776